PEKRPSRTAAMTRCMSSSLMDEDNSIRWPSPPVVDSCQRSRHTANRWPRRRAPERSVGSLDRHKEAGSAAGFLRGSHGVQVPVVLEVGDGGLELLQLGFLARDEDVDVLRIDVLVQHFAVVQLAQGIAQVVWQAG